MSGKTMPRSLILMILLILMIQILPFHVSAVGPTILVEARFDEGEGIQEADVKSGQHGVVYFPGTVTADMAAGGSVQKIIVTLQVSSEQGWSVSVEPPQMTLEPGETRPFVVEGTVPSETSCYVVDTITLTGRGVAYPGAFQDIIDPITGTIIVLQYCEFNLATDMAIKKASLGSRVEFNLRILNQGNGRDIFYVEIVNIDELSGKGFQASLSQERVEIETRGEEEIKVIVETPSSSSGLDDNKITVKVSSSTDYSESPPERYFDFIIKIPPQNFIFSTEFLIILAIIICAAAGIGSLVLIRRKRRNKSKRRKK